MTEKDILEKIKASAEQIEIPESLSPAEIEKMLNKKKESGKLPLIYDKGGEKFEQNKADTKKEDSSQTKKRSLIYHFANRKVVAAASVLLVCSVCGIAAVKSGILGAASGTTNKLENTVIEGEAAAGDAVMPEQSAESMEAVAEGQPMKEGETAQNETAAATQPKQNAGEMYQVASSYEEVYQLLDNYEEVYWEEEIWIEDSIVESTTAERFESSAAAEESGVVDMITNSMEKEESASDASTAESGKGDYSTTNLQTQGVDESDIVKTDGKYIYTVSQNKILITDIQGEKLEQKGQIELNLDASVESILEMYVDSGKLILITSQYDTSLETNKSFEIETSGSNSTSQTDSIPETDASAPAVEVSEEPALPTVEAVTDKEEQANILEVATEVAQAVIQEVTGIDVVEDIAYTEEVSPYYIERNQSTNIYTYDVTNPEKPVLLGKVNQDGNYHTSRKIGDIVYLFTNKNLWNNNQPADGSVRDSGKYLPLVNGEEIPYDSIYLPKEGSQGLIISSVNVNRSSAIVDKAMILNNCVEIYVGNESCYLYNNSYQDGKDYTEIAKFTFKDGQINAVNATAVEGQIYDTFAINEKNGKLRVLTTVWDWRGNGDRSNSLYLLDENLSLTGTLNGIAPGEDIYAARYIGDIVYFITYRNTDPLFAVDISEETAPKILGELEITGFSEYLHPWGEDKLLGIGYETDPETGMEEGIKLVMFDISNPTELKILDTLVIENVDYCAALYNYKCIIAEENANIIGFATETYTSNYYQREINYFAFAWEDGRFVNLLAEGLTSGVNSSIYRGIYVGDKFFIASPEQIRSFDRNNNYKKIDEFVF